MAISTDPQVKTQPQPTPRTSRRGAPVTRHPRRTRLPAIRGPRFHRADAQKAATASAAPTIALAGLQLIVGYEWLVSGIDKVLLGTFPDQLPGLLASAISGGRIPGFFATLLQHVVAPNAAIFGFFIEWAETLAGLGLVSAGVVALLRPLAERYLKLQAAIIYAYLARLLDALSPLAATGAGLLGLSFFLLDGLPAPWFAPGVAYGGAIDTGLFLAALSAVLVVSQLTSRRHAAR